MVTFQKENHKLYLYKDGKVVSEIHEPFVLWDKETRCILQIGDKKNVLSYYKTAIEACKRHQWNLHDDWVVQELPQDVNVLNDILRYPEKLQFFQEKKDNIA